MTPKAGINPKDSVGAKRLSLHLVPSASIIHEALAMTEGALKYGPFNWRTKAVQAMLYIGAALRHIEKWVDREDCDPKTLVHHLGNAKASLGIILDALETGNLQDDRPEKGPAPRLLQDAEDRMVPHLQALFGKEKAPK